MFLPTAISHAFHSVNGQEVPCYACGVNGGRLFRLINPFGEVQSRVQIAPLFGRQAHRYHAVRAWVPLIEEYRAFSCVNCDVLLKRSLSVIHEGYDGGIEFMLDRKHKIDSTEMTRQCKYHDQVCLARWSITVKSLYCMWQGTKRTVCDDATVDTDRMCDFCACRL